MYICVSHIKQPHSMVPMCNPPYAPARVALRTTLGLYALIMSNEDLGEAWRLGVAACGLSLVFMCMELMVIISNYQNYQNYDQ